MHMIRKTLYIAAAFILLSTAAHASGEGDASGAVPQQPQVIASILAKETNIAQSKQIIDLLGRIDETYIRLYENLSKGGKITIFFDPAHGKWNNGMWEGEMTGRTSCTGLTEEIYSMGLSRELYKLLTSNKFIKVESTDDFVQVMKGKSDIYNNIPFTDTVRMAHDSNAFIIVSEHLNNISRLLKASGLMNIPGIHIIDRWGVRYLSYIKDSNKGFLTLYNRLDVTDFSRQYALNLKEALVGQGMKANSWEFGAVPDDRFTYFVDFPISVIFESGFISNPEDEMLLRDPASQKKIAESQYASLLLTIKEKFGVDISGRSPEKSKKPDEDMFTLLKLSRIAIFYINSCEPQKAAAVISLMESNYARSNTPFMAPFREIRKTLLLADSYFSTSRKLLRNKNYKSATRYIYLARRTLRNKPLFSNLHAMYSGEYYSLGVPAKEPGAVILPKKITAASELSQTAGFFKSFRSPVTTPVILTIEDNQSLENAIIRALNPDRETTAKLMKSLGGACTSTRVKVKTASSKDGKASFSWKNMKEKVNFTQGIYLVYLNKNLTVANVSRVNTVRLDPGKYQNYQYMKNSHFSIEEKERAL